VKEQPAENEKGFDEGGGREVKRARYFGVAVVFTSLLIVANGAFGTVIQDIQGTLQNTEWYYGAGDYFKPNYNNGGLDDAQIDMFSVTIQGQSTASYYMYYGDFIMSPSSLVADLSAGGMADGVFAAGATLTINSDLYRDFDDYGIAASGDLIIANVMYEWELQEQGSPYPNNTVRGHASFDITGGALSDPLLNSDGLVLNDFSLNFTFENTSPTVTDFTTLLGDAIYTCSGPKVQIGALPEPATMLLLGIGGLAILRRRQR